MKTWEQCCDHFGVNVDRGLSPDQVKRNLDKYGPNGKDIFITLQINTSLCIVIYFQNKTWQNLSWANEPDDSISSTTFQDFWMNFWERFLNNKIMMTTVFLTNFCTVLSKSTIHCNCHYLNTWAVKNSTRKSRCLYLQWTKCTFDAILTAQICNLFLCPIRRIIP